MHSSHILRGVASRGLFALGRKGCRSVGRSALYLHAKWALGGIKPWNVMRLKQRTGHPIDRRVPKLRHVIKLVNTFPTIYNIMG